MILNIKNRQKDFVKSRFCLVMILFVDYKTLFPRDQIYEIWFVFFFVNMDICKHLRYKIFNVNFVADWWAKEWDGSLKIIIEKCYNPIIFLSYRKKKLRQSIE